MKNQIECALENIRNTKPLILNVTNYVTMDFVANGLLSLGASPIMSMSKNEAKDLMQLVKAVVINLGTLNDEFISYCEHVCQIANDCKVPIILDPVGAGASQYRTSTCIRLINNFLITMIRGNASEIMALCESHLTTCGVDTAVRSEMAIESAKNISKKYNAAVVVSGETDVIIDQENFDLCRHGSELMPKITGSGCLLTAVLAAFIVVEKDRFQAAKIGVYYYTLCGEQAAKNAMGPASFKIHFLDLLSSCNL